VKPAVFVMAMLLLGSCGRKDEKTAEASGPATAGPGDDLVIIPADSPKLKQLRVETVKMAEFPIAEVTCPGKIEAKPERVSRIVLPVAGRISSVLVKIGDFVRQGDTVLTIESPDIDTAESAYLQSMAALNQAKSALIKAQADFDRANDLLQHDAIAKKEVISAENALAQAKAAVEQAQASREQAVRRLALLGLKPGEFGEKVCVRSPLSGKVLELNVAAGEYRNDTSAPLISIADLSTVWVSSDVPESAIRLVRPGEHVDITLTAYPGEVFHGRVTRIADIVDPQTRTVKVRADMANPGGRLRPEMFGSIRHSEGARRSPVLPVGAVIQGDGRSIIFVEEGPGRFRQTEVAVGPRTGDVVPVVRGVKAGDRVVVDGAMLLKPQ
jgi:cobalt-zinc-cadmium efflux system membrane fusion protein